MAGIWVPSCRILCFALACFFLFFVRDGSADQRVIEKSPSHPRTLIPESQWITDLDARLALARILAGNQATLDESLEEYRRLLDRNPSDPLIRVETAALLVRKGDPTGARSLIGSIQDESVTDPALLAALADLETSFGHAARSRFLFQRAIRLSDRPENLRMKLADSLNLWGDFYRAEALYRDRLHADPGDTEATLRLAALLRSSERYAESEALYTIMLHERPDSREALLGLLQVKRLQNRREEAQRLADQFLEHQPRDPQVLLVKADILFSRRNYEQALAVYSGVAESGCCRVKGLIGMGKAYREQKKEARAEACFAQALNADPRDEEARFYASGQDQAPSGNFLQTLVKDRELSPFALEKWARLYAEHGFNKMAVECHEACLERDPEYFPSRIGRAEMLAVDHQYERAVGQFEALAQTYPGNRKILFGWARALAWGKRYEDSKALYDRLHALAPADPVPLIEKARTAAWAKQMDLASETYEELLMPAVDRLLADELKSVVPAGSHTGLTEALRKLTHAAEKGSTFQGFEAFTHAWEGFRPSLSLDTDTRIKTILTRLLPRFTVQKSAFLEREGKRLAWDKRFTRAMDAYEELLVAEPGNEEALFDYAQVQCALDLRDREENTYQRLLDLDRRHNLAGMAMERIHLRQGPSLRLEQVYWSEKGRDALTRIDRYRTDLGVEVPVDYRFRLRLTAHHWTEHPSYGHESYGAKGFTLGFTTILNPFVKGEAGWTRKIYSHQALEDTDTGYAHLWWNVRDFLTLGLGYDRTDELYNDFGIRQGIQADAWWLSIGSQLTRSLEVLGRAKALNYSDDNRGVHFMISAGYSWTDHPRIFKTTLTGEHRDTDQPNVYQYEKDLLTNIIHPYWTPKDYYGGALTFEWSHDLSKIFYCGAPLHIYQLAFTLGTDTEHNPSMELRGEWRYEFRDRWTFGLKGLVHRSRLWDAEGVWFQIRYSF